MKSRKLLVLLIMLAAVAAAFFRLNWHQPTTSPDYGDSSQTQPTNTSASIAEDSDRGSPVRLTNPEDSNTAAQLSRFGQTVVETKDKPAVEKYAADHSLQIIESTSLSDGRTLLTLAEAADNPAVKQMAQNLPGTKTEKNLIFRPVFTPNDPRYPEQWALPQISAPAAWDVSQGSNSITIAVIDSGILFSQTFGTDCALGCSQPDFPDSKKWANAGENCGSTDPTIVCAQRTDGIDNDVPANGKIDDWQGWDFMGGFAGGSNCPNGSGGGYVDNDNDPGPYSCDDPFNQSQLNKNDSSADALGHATLVSSTAGAATNNGQLIAGVAINAKLMNLRIFDGYGFGDLDDIVAAIDYAAAKGAKVINLSLALSTCTGSSSTLETALANARSLGVTVVGAAGNEAQTTPGSVCYPASSPYVIAVGATDSGDNRTSWSNFGPELDIMAPGLAILADNAPAAANGNSTTSTASGTSLSTPLVSGVAALMYAQFPGITPAQVADGLAASADKPAGMNGANRTDLYGYGRLNAYSALKIDSLSCPYPVFKNYNNGSLGSGQRMLAYRHGNTNISHLTYAQLNNTGSACVEAHVWNPGYTSWRANIATGLRASDPASGMLVSSWSRVDSQVSLNYVTYGNVEVHRFSPNLQKLPGYYDVPTNLVNVSSATGTFVAGDFLGAGYDQLVYILYSGRNGGMEIHMFNPAMTSAIGFYDLPTDVGAVNNGVFVAGDFLDRGHAQLAYVSYGNTEVHLLDIRGGQAKRVYEVPTDLIGTSAATGTFVAGEFVGRGNNLGYTQLIYVIYNNGHGGCGGSGCVETHMFDPTLTRINGIQEIVTNLTGFTP
ncbi:hypothetical protein A3F65_00765 [Candidatus Saccharibacteria bacterium RIFCSPHIGHO2_12_FULL_47_16b]|nr:MAG: hypothetical protein A3F65_00765 [Candidatus Saccharibacteria bacterium RIFCSPHIGHO2_12_FULL_47_16b]